MYAIVNISGKQYKATEGARLRVPRQSGDSGAKLSFDDILLISNSDSTQVGKPNVSGAKVTATILNHGRERKILVYKKKRRKGYQRKNGHRQWYTE
ncbi:MAG: 50S ribosomal protein L21 [Candidatus Neomarinimicrobiota bacterium]|nr:50S ribosomal protein L21 [Candidatus Neomarinimicrobiota bacterium]